MRKSAPEFAKWTSQLHQDQAPLDRHSNQVCPHQRHHRSGPRYLARAPEGGWLRNHPAGDRLGRSIRVVEPEVTTAGSMRRMVITILGMSSYMELEFVKRQTKSWHRGRESRRRLQGPEKCRWRRSGSLLVSPKRQMPRDLKVSRVIVYRH